MKKCKSCRYFVSNIKAILYPNHPLYQLHASNDIRSILNNYGEEARCSQQPKYKKASSCKKYSAIPKLCEKCGGDLIGVPYYLSEALCVNCLKFYVRKLIDNYVLTKSMFYLHYGKLLNFFIKEQVLLKLIKYIESFDGTAVVKLHYLEVLYKLSYRIFEYEALSTNTNWMILKNNTESNIKINEQFVSLKKKRAFQLLRELSHKYTIKSIQIFEKTNSIFDYRLWDGGVIHKITIVRPNHSEALFRLRIKIIYCDFLCNLQIFQEYICLFRAYAESNLLRCIEKIHFRTHSEDYDDLHSFLIKANFQVGYKKKIEDVVQLNNYKIKIDLRESNPKKIFDRYLNRNVENLELWIFENRKFLTIILNLIKNYQETPLFSNIRSFNLIFKENYFHKKVYPQRNLNYTEEKFREDLFKFNIKLKTLKTIQVISHL